MRAGGGVGIGILAERVSMVIKPPPGVGGGSELSGRPRPGACGGTRADGRERGEGWGQGRRCAHGAERKRTTRTPFCEERTKGGSGADAERCGTIMLI